MAKLAAIVAGSSRNNVCISNCSVVHSVVPMGDSCPMSNNSTAQGHAVQVKMFELDQTWMPGLSPATTGGGYDTMSITGRNRQG
jgi:hypothetical protein